MTGGLPGGPQVYLGGVLMRGLCEENKPGPNQCSLPGRGWRCNLKAAYAPAITIHHEVMQPGEAPGLQPAPCPMICELPEL
jgi:hypothetical protein